LLSISDDAAIISAIGVVLGVVFVVIQLRHMEMHRNLDISMKLFEWAESDRLRKAFRWIENEFQFQDYDKYKAQEATDSEASEYPHEVTAFFEQIGFLVEKRFVDLDIIDDRLGSHIVSNWKTLEPWIMAVRQEKENNEFGRHFQRLYERTIEYMKKTDDTIGQTAEAGR
jgi:hypothetical protein